MSKEMPMSNDEGVNGARRESPSLVISNSSLFSHSRSRRSRERGSVLIIVMWVAFGLVSIALYFAHSMSFELRASDNRTASMEAEQAIDGAARYVTYVLRNLGTNGTVPDPLLYQREGVAVGQARFWLIGRENLQQIS